MARLFTFALIAMVLLMSTEARRSGGGRSSSRSSRSYSRSSSYSRGRSSYHYTGIVVIAGPNGTYYNGYGSQCPHGCAVHGRCGTYDECTMSWSDWIWTILFCLCFLCCGCCAKCPTGGTTTVVEEHVSVHSDRKSDRTPRSSLSSSEKRKKQNLEPLIGGQ